MNAYNPLDSMKRLEASGLDRRQAEAIAAEINQGTDEFVTKDYLNERLDAFGDRLLVRMGVMTAGIVALAVAVVSLLDSLK